MGLKTKVSRTANTIGMRIVFAAASAATTKVMPTQVTKALCQRLEEIMKGTNCLRIGPMHHGDGLSRGLADGRARLGYRAESVTY